MLYTLGGRQISVATSWVGLVVEPATLSTCMMWIFCVGVSGLLNRGQGVVVGDLGHCSGQGLVQM